MHKAFLLLAVGTFSALTALSPVHADETTKKKPKSFEEKKAIRLEKAEAKLEKAQANVNCIKVSKNMKALKKCNTRKRIQKSTQ